MGTNYYVRTPSCDKACEHCSESKLTHLGKSSVGWKFSCRADQGWTPGKALVHWLERVISGPIEDEYGVHMTHADFLAFVMGKQLEGRHNEGNGSYTSGGFTMCPYEFF